MNCRNTHRNLVAFNKKLKVAFYEETTLVYDILTLVVDFIYAIASLAPVVVFPTYARTYSF